MLQTLVPGTAGEALLWLGCGNLWEFSHSHMAPVLAAASFREFTLIHYSENFPHLCGFVIMNDKQEGVVLGRFWGEIPVN